MKHTVKPATGQASITNFKAARCRMPNDECQMTKEMQSPNTEGRSGVHWPGLSFGFRYSFGFRHSSFGFGNWFMENLLGLATVHLNHEPTPPRERPRP